MKKQSRCSLASQWTHARHTTIGGKCDLCISLIQCAADYIQRGKPQNGIKEAENAAIEYQFTS